MKTRQVVNNRTRRRINITLSPETLELIDAVNQDNRSAFLDKAARFYAAQLQRANLRQNLKRAYLERAKEDLAMAQEWEPLERELWKKL
jgi:metal-responsive CopG/Arc/MetJ family transcriptional regulator